MALFEQLRAKCFGRRPGLPRAQKGCGGRRVRRCRSWDALSGGSPCSDAALSPLPISSPWATPCGGTPGAEASPADHSPAAFAAPPSTTGTARSMSAGFTAGGGFGEASFHTPPRGLSRTYSEDEEVRSFNLANSWDNKPS